MCVSEEGECEGGSECEGVRASVCMRESEGECEGGRASVKERVCV